MGKFVLDHGEERRCHRCGKKLYSQYYYLGYCKDCFVPADNNLVADAKAAKEHGLSYGQYMALKKDGLL